MKIAEIYKSIQGEGRLSGTPSVFVRTSGCNLRCWFCDTPYASWSPEGEDYAVDEILAEVEEWDCRHAVVTGGEPMLLAELVPLCEGLQSRGIHVTIETAGTIDLAVPCDLMSISPKFAASGPDPARHPHWARRHQRQRRQRAVIERLLRDYDYQLKFVLDHPEEVAEVDEFLAEHPATDAARVWLMPQGRTIEELAARAVWLEALCRERAWRYCPRRQIEWFGPVRRT